MLFSTVDPKKITVETTSDSSTHPIQPPPLSTPSRNKNNECKGNGGCLILSSNTLSLSSDYIQNPSILCHYHCQPKECPNYQFCHKKCPEWILQCNCGLCDNCSSTFGMRLTFLPTTNNQTCLLCGRTNMLSIQYKHCSHSACIDCYGLSFYDEDDYYESSYLLEKEPKFPYPKEVEEEYYDDNNGEEGDEEGDGMKEKLERWKVKYPLIPKYVAAWNDWDEKRTKSFQELIERRKKIQVENQQKKKGKASMTMKKSQAFQTQGEEQEEEEDEDGVGGAVMLGNCPICGK